MILNIPDLLRELVPDAAKKKHVSVAFLQCTNPVYLVFTDDHTRPTWVVKRGPTGRIKRQHELMSVLHVADPDLTPKPLAWTPISDESALLIQEGLPGIPWFRLSSRFRSPNDWFALRKRATEALARFESVVRTNDRWQDSVNPAESLRRLLSTCVESQVGLSLRAVEFVESAAKSLEGLGVLNAWWQHGDFCLNNLLVAESRIGIVDFDDFGATSMPLHDCFGLALSIRENVSKAMPWGCFRDDIEACLAACQSGVDLTSDQLDGLFMHSLLFGIVESLSSPTRVERRTWLTMLIEKVAAASSGSEIPRCYCCL